MFVCRRGDGHSISGRKKWGIERTALDMMSVVLDLLVGFGKFIQNRFLVVTGVRK